MSNKLKLIADYFGVPLESLLDEEKEAMLWRKKAFLSGIRTYRWLLP